MRQDAVIRRLETLADAANQLSDELKVRHPEIPWRQVYGLRNLMAHRYLGSINLERVWTTVEQSLPPLEIVVEQELHSLDRSQELE